MSRGWPLHSGAPTIRSDSEPGRNLIENGTHLYYLEAEDADVHDFDLLLDSIDPDWRGHLNLNATHVGL